ncbi:hypothetical protein AgCh_021119 [Apium graveolens]
MFKSETSSQMIKNEEQLKTVRGMQESICPEEKISNCFSSNKSDKIEHNYDNASLDRKQISDRTKFENVGEYMQTKFDMARTKMRDSYISIENKRKRIQVIESQDLCGNIEDTKPRPLSSKVKVKKTMKKSKLMPKRKFGRVLY